MYINRSVCLWVITFWNAWKTRLTLKAHVLSLLAYSVRFYSWINKLYVWNYYIFYKFRANSIFAWKDKVLPFIDKKNILKSSFIYFLSSLNYFKLTILWIPWKILSLNDPFFAPDFEEQTIKIQKLEKELIEHTRLQLGLETIFQTIGA